MQGDSSQVYIDERTVDVHVGRLRKALNLPGRPDPIRTVRGAGYAFDESLPRNTTAGAMLAETSRAERG